MPVISLDIDKIVAEKKEKAKGDIKISSNIAITDIKPEPQPNSKEESIKFDFAFSLTYDPKIAEISINGHLIYSEKPKRIKEILSDWKNGKKIEQTLLVELINTLLYGCNLKVLQYSQDLKLPAHIPLPKITGKIDTKNYIG